MKNDIVWPKDGKCGRVNGVPFKTIWKKCEREADKYCDKKWSEGTERKK